MFRREGMRTLNKVAEIRIEGGGVNASSPSGANPGPDLGFRTSVSTLDLEEEGDNRLDIC